MVKWRQILVNIKSVILLNSEAKNLDFGELLQFSGLIFVHIKVQEPEKLSKWQFWRLKICHKLI